MAADTDNPTPQPDVWPECGTCSVPFALRRSFIFTGGGRHEWLWHRECKHKGKPVLMTPTGPSDMEVRYS